MLPMWEAGSSRMLSRGQFQKGCGHHLLGLCTPRTGPTALGRGGSTQDPGFWGHCRQIAALLSPPPCTPQGRPPPPGPHFYCCPLSLMQLPPILPERTWPPSSPKECVSPRESLVRGETQGTFKEQKYELLSVRQGSRGSW